jgi:uncharacterized protein
VRVFVDTSYYIARVIIRDQWHKAALKAVRPDVTFLTSSLAINETISLLQARGYLSAALTFLERIRQGAGVHILHPDSALQSEAWDQFGKWAGSGASAVDCTSFALMRQLGIRRAFTFDAHFRMAGLEILKG